MIRAHSATRRFCWKRRRRSKALSATAPTKTAVIARTSHSRLPKNRNLCYTDDPDSKPGNRLCPKTILADDFSVQPLCLCASVVHYFSGNKQPQRHRDTEVHREVTFEARFRS